MRNIGAEITADGCEFTLWAPFRKEVELHVLSPVERLVKMCRDDSGYWTAHVKGVGNEALYFYRLDGAIERPDPASRFQPQGVHGPSAVVDMSKFHWSSTAPGTALSRYIIYELHVGTFTEEGRFASATERLSELGSIGINAVEVMPIAQFPGKRNWGYDGVYPFAPHESYGGVDGFKSFVDAAHSLRLSVILDVVYNHLGPEGNYLRDFGPYFTDRYKTPWGESINFDGPYSDEVCDFFIGNALYWIREFQVDALRLDAVHAINDMGARPFLRRLADAVEEESERSGINKYLIAESDLNDSKIIRKDEQGGFGIHAQWSDDFHHSVHTLMTGESRGYYADFGNVDHMQKTLQNGFCYSGDYSTARRRSHGNDASDMDTSHFVVCAQNHDQVGNRMLGERLISLTDTRRARFAAATVLLSPYIPLLFMGEEYGEDNPFLYFADHSDESLREAVRMGRREEFADFHDSGEPPDPFDFQTFERSRIDWSKKEREPYSAMLRYYRALIATRRKYSAISAGPRDRVGVKRFESTDVLSAYYVHDTEPAVCLFNFGGAQAVIDFDFPGEWKRVFDTADGGSPPESERSIEVRDNDGVRLLLEPFQSAVYVSARKGK